MLSLAGSKTTDPTHSDFLYARAMGALHLVVSQGDSGKNSTSSSKRYRTRRELLLVLEELIQM